jgi:hypothetical protein
MGKWDDFTERQFHFFRYLFIAGVLFMAGASSLTYLCVGYLNSIQDSPSFIEVNPNQRNLMDMVGMENWIAIMLISELTAMIFLWKIPMLKNKILRGTFVQTSFIFFLLFGFNFFHDLVVAMRHFL